ncbi:zinc-ribbon domain-containing protein [Proteocatella sphenisci]|uniref:zinc-ribbon domain-containing protein n=1 Tax=Proteocatella sphenisci TaxID=181070 RepID=UPI00048DA935|nr:zinc-ribbon domain-containing protein [Proteocatella sphenisci]
MSIFDKVNKMARNVTEKATEAMEVTRLNTKVGEENRNILEYQKKIGEIIWNKFEAGEVLSPELAEVCENIKNSKGVIAGIMNDIQKLKDEVDPSESPAAPSESSAEAKGVVCPACGAANTEETKFCGECGAKL